MKKEIFLLILLFLGYPVMAQTPVLDSLRMEFDRAHADTTKLRLLHDLTAESHHVNPQQCIDFATKYRALAEKIGDKEHLTISNYMLGVGHYYLSNTEQALAYASTSLQYAEELRKPSFIVDANNFIGTVYFQENNYPRSLEYFLKSLEVSREHQIRDRIGTAFSNIADVYVVQNDLVRARDYYEQALDYYRQEGEEFYSAIVLNNLAEKPVASPDTSIQYLLQALEIFRKNSAEDGIAHVNNNLGKEYMLLEDYPTAIRHFREAIAIWEKPEMNFLPGLMDAYTNLGSAYGRIGQTATAEKWLERSLEIGEGSDFREQLKDAYLAISELAEKRGDPVAALAAYKQAMALKDSLLNETKTREIANYEVLYETGQKEKELIQTQLELAQQTNLRNRILLGGAVLILILPGLFLYFRSRQRLVRKEAELALKLEKAEAVKLRELDRVKSNFFANISHEFRTPITLILSPLDQLIAGTLKGDPQKYFRIMRRNGRRLLSLVNQLLDLSKLEAGKMTLHLEEKDLTRQVRALAHSFESAAVRKNIAYTVTAPEEPIVARFDPDKLEKILSNLLSNAFKFTPEEGQVAFYFSLEKDRAIFEVIDTGIGIPADELPLIFERFYHASAHSDLQANSGIGLSLTAELVKLYGGEISVESEKEAGSAFRVGLPMEFARHSTPVAATTPVSIAVSPALDEQPPQTDNAVSKNSTRILIVEDNPDVRAYLVDQLSGDYQVLEAKNGADGLALALEHSPDLIVTDIMMPVRNGIELCNDLKKNTVTSHIPVIMLTAKAEREDKLEGLETGADDYLVKPFDTAEIRLRIRNLIERQRRLREKYGQFVKLKPTAVEAQSVDEKFLADIRSIIESHLDDEQFSVVSLAEKVGLSRSQLHRKLKALTGEGPNEIIRRMRLERARQLLEQNAGNASEVTYMVGFNSPAYFAKCFRDEFGVSPTEIIRGGASKV